MEKNKKTSFIIVIVIISVIALSLVYIFSNELSFKNKDNSGKSNLNNNLSCKYKMLKNPSDLNDEEIKSIASVLEKSMNGNSIDMNTLKISLYSNNIYRIDFELFDKVGAYVLIDYVWNEDGVWKNLGSGSDIEVSSIDSLQKKICDECGNCNSKCKYATLTNPSSLTNADKKQIIDSIQNNNDNCEIDEATFSINLIEEKIYEVNFELVDKVGAYNIVDLVWNENGVWKDLGIGSSYTKDQLDELKGVINIECE